ncbi:MAG: ABC transporter substrate-binding protein [Bacteriovoracales bacterium]|nr:ABC transporter substrate-binding protein [Bacteriovoracales bacterium]
MKKTLTFSPLLFFLPWLLVANISCLKQEGSDSKTSKAQIPLRAKIETLDPANAYDAISLAVAHQALEPLYEYHYLQRPYRLVPLLAKGLPKIEGNGTRYTIHIKEKVSYHKDPAFRGQTRYVKALDFIHQIKRIALVETKSKGWFLFKDRIVGLDLFRAKAKTYKDIASIEVEGLKTLGDSTLVIQLTKPYPQLLHVLAMAFTTPVPFEAIDYYKNNLRERLIGTGPFQLVRWNPGLNLKMKKNPHYRKALYPSRGDKWAQEKGLLGDAGKPLPFLSHIEFKILKEDQTQWLNFLDGKIDFLSIPKDNFNTALTPRGELSKELAGRDIALQIVPTFTSFWVGFNMKNPILGKNFKLRKAIAHAIDVDKFVRLFTNDTGQKANSIFVPGIAGYDPKQKLPFEYDLAKAKRLMKEAGYPKGFGLPRFTYDVRGPSTLSRQQGEYIKNSLKKIGVEIEVVLNTFPGYIKKSNEGKIQIHLDGWSLDYPDAENIIQLLSSGAHPPGPNASFYHNPEVDGLIERLKLLSDGPEKFNLMKRIEKLVFEDLPWVPLFYRRNYFLHYRRLQNLRMSPLIQNYLKYLRIEETASSYKKS